MIEDVKSEYSTPETPIGFDLGALKEIELQKVVTKDEEKRVAKFKELSEYFANKKDKIERNSAIIQAYRRWIYAGRGCKVY